MKPLLASRWGEHGSVRRRFLAKIDKDEHGCWIWAGASIAYHGDGPARRPCMNGLPELAKTETRWSYGRPINARLVAWLLFKNHNPPRRLGMCDRTWRCVNPDHSNMRTKAIATRNARIVDEYKRARRLAGERWTLERIGQRFGVTREYVRIVLLGRHEPWWAEIARALYAPPTDSLEIAAAKFSGFPLTTVRNALSRARKVA